MPSPVTALTATEPGWSATSRLASSGRQVGLVERRAARARRSAPISASTSRTASIWPCGVGGAGVDDVDQVVGPAGDLERAT